MTSATPQQPRRLGSSGPAVFPLALGCMGMSGMYGPADETESIATIHAALDAGVTLLDTGDYYGAGHNELLIGRALRDRRDNALVSVKFGALRGPDGSWIGIDTRPAATKNFVAYSLMRLGLDHVDIYRPGRLDPNVPIEDTIGAIGELVKAGYVRAIGLSEVGPGTIRRRTRSTRSAICRSILLDQPWPGEDDLSRARGTRYRCDGLWRAVARAAQRFSPDVADRPSCPPAALHRREPRAQLAVDRGVPEAGCREARHDLAARDCVGARESSDDRAAVGARPARPARSSRWALSRCRSRRTTCGRSSRPCRPPLLPGRGTTNIRCAFWTASGPRCAVHAAGGSLRSDTLASRR